MKIDEASVGRYIAWHDEEPDIADDDVDEAVETESFTAELAEEREQALEAELYLDEHPTAIEQSYGDEIASTMIRHEMLKTAIGRIESAARTQKDFEHVLVCWDKLEQNEVRRLQNHESLRGDIPLEYGKTMDGVIVPADYTQPYWRQILHGYYWDVMHDCPFEMDELMTDVTISQTIRNLKDDHKVILYWHYIRRLSCMEIGRMRGQTDRNIRKTRAVIIGKLRKKIFQAWQVAKVGEGGLSARRRGFMYEMQRLSIDTSTRKR